jgi:KDO2-lipid IV(A) lauroyltransferase
MSFGLTAHVGNWELGASVLGARGFLVNAIVRQQPSARLDALFQSRRIQRGVRVLPMHGAATAVQACLKRNEFVVLLADLDFTGRDRHVPFFGRPARLPRGPAVLAKRSGAPILPAFVLRQADDTFRFRAYPPIIPDRSRSIDAIQKCICSILEEVIGDHPDQWFAFEPLWPFPIPPR